MDDGSFWLELADIHNIHIHIRVYSGMMAQRGVTPARSGIGATRLNSQDPLEI